MSDRGEFRSIHTVLVDGPDYQALTPHERLMVFVVKMSLGASGIDVVPSMIGTLCERTGLDEHIASAVLESLEESGWIQRERNILWLVDGLRHDPGLTIDHTKHRKGLLNHVRGMPRLAIVRRFIVAYYDWFDDPETLLSGYPLPQDNDGDPNDSLSEAYPAPADTLSNKGRGIREEGKGRGKEEPSAAVASVADPLSEPDAPDAKSKRKRTSRSAASPPDAKPERESWLTPAGDAWEETFGAGSFDYGRNAKVLSPLHHAGIEPAEIGRRLREYIRQRRGKYCTVPDFKEHHGEYVPVDRGPALLEGGVMSDWLERETRPPGMDVPRGRLAS